MYYINYELKLNIVKYIKLHYIKYIYVRIYFIRVYFIILNCI